MGHEVPEFVVDGLVEQTPEGPRLIGTRCAGCNTLYFPQKSSCANPGCDEKSPQPAHLPAAGTLYSYTIQRYQPPSLFRIDDWQPYIIGLVELGEGVRVMAMLTGIEEDQLRIGMDLQLVTQPLYTDSEKGEVRTFKFAPTGKFAPAGESA